MSFQSNGSVNIPLQHKGVKYDSVHEIMSMAWHIILKNKYRLSMLKCVHFTDIYIYSCINCKHQINYYKYVNMQILIHITTCNGEQSLNVLQYASKPLFE